MTLERTFEHGRKENRTKRTLVSLGWMDHDGEILAGAPEQVKPHGGGGPII